jgi:hypothetical protein
MPNYAQNNPLRSIADYEDQYARADANALALQQGRAKMDEYQRASANALALQDVARSFGPDPKANANLILQRTGNVKAAQDYLKSNADIGHVDAQTVQQKSSAAHLDKQSSEIDQKMYFEDISREASKVLATPTRAAAVQSVAVMMAKYGSNPQASRALQDELVKALQLPDDPAAITKWAQTHGMTAKDYSTLQQQKQPSAVQEYEYAVKQGYKGSLTEWKNQNARAGAASTSVSYGAPIAGVDAQGNPVFFQPDKKGGAPAIVQGVAPPKKDTPAALQEKLAQNAVTLTKIDKALTMLEARPESLGLKNYVGDPIMQRVDPGGVEVRAMIADIGGQKIHDRSGAAVTVGEAERLKPYIPAATDSPAAAAKKLQLFRQEYAAMQQAIQSGASITQAASKGGERSGAPGGGVSGEDPLGVR